MSSGPFQHEPDHGGDTLSLQRFPMRNGCPHRSPDTEAEADIVAKGLVLTGERTTVIRAVHQSLNSGVP
jgi:hypothetical protein